MIQALGNSAVFDEFVVPVFITAFILCLVTVASWWILTWITPESVLERYLRPPHFCEFESFVYRHHHPTTLIRTNLFSFAIAIPFFRRFRKLGDIQKNVPLWFNIACRIYVYAMVLPFFLSVIYLASAAYW